MAYYRTEVGKFKKGLLNAKRSGSEPIPERAGKPEQPLDKEKLDGRADGCESSSERDGRSEHEQPLDKEKWDVVVDGCESSSERDGRSEHEQPLDKEELDGRADGFVFYADMVSYLRMVTSLIEGRRVRRDEILELLARVMRQHSMARRNRTDYHVWYLNQHPP